jgi:hypothetical protein
LTFLTHLIVLAFVYDLELENFLTRTD